MIVVRDVDVNTETYHARIGRYAVRHIRKGRTGVGRDVVKGAHIWVLEFKVTVLLLIGGGEPNPGLKAN